MPQDAIALSDGPIERSYYSRGDNFPFPGLHISKRDHPTVGKDIRSLAIMANLQPAVDTRMNCFTGRSYG